MDRIGKILGIFAIVGVLFLMMRVAYAGNASIVGSWQTVDHKLNRPSSVIRIWEFHGKFYGKVAKVYHKDAHRSGARCTACKGELHNKPIIGMIIIRGLVAVSPVKYVKGFILDPSNGKFYRCHMTVTDKGQLLKVRGYLGFPLLGRTDAWRRLPGQSG